MFFLEYGILSINIAYHNKTIKGVLLHVKGGDIMKKRNNTFYQRRKNGF